MPYGAGKTVPFGPCIHLTLQAWPISPPNSPGTSLPSFSRDPAQLRRAKLHRDPPQPPLCSQVQGGTAQAPAGQVPVSSLGGVHNPSTLHNNSPEANHDKVTVPWTAIFQTINLTDAMQF